VHNDSVAARNRADSSLSGASALILTTLPVVRWEYRVVSVADGRYTDLLNRYAAEGWELQTVAHDVRATTPATPGQTGNRLPVPPGLGKLGQAASKLSELEKGEASAPEPPLTTKLLWVLRRPVEDV
jgi:hypothetical protein